MRLLAKSDLAKAQANDKAKEVAEGLKLSRKVDGLRELVVKEEEVLNKFRHETLSTIAKETLEAETKRNQLLAEVEVLREEKELGLKDVEVKKAELDSLSLKLSDSEKKLHEQSVELNMKNEEITSTLKGSQDELERVRSHREGSEKLHKEADDKNLKATQALNQARIELANALAVKDKTEQFVVEANKNLDDKRKELRDKEEDLNKKETELVTLKVQLADQRATLDREIKRNGTSIKRPK